MCGYTRAIRGVPARTRLFVGALAVLTAGLASQAVAATTTVAVDTPLLMGGDATFQITVTVTHKFRWFSTQVLLDGVPHYCHGLAEGHGQYGPWDPAQTDVEVIDVPRPAAGAYTVSVKVWNGTACDNTERDSAIAAQKLYVTDCTAPADQDVPVDDTCTYFMKDFTGFCPDLAGFAGVTVQQNPTVGDDYAPGAPVPANVQVLDGLNLIGNYDFNLTPVDDTPPVITCSADVTEPADANCQAVIALITPTATDNCGVPTVDGVRSDGKPLTDPFDLGETTIQWTATDAAAKTSDCIQKITVQDTTPPVITTCPPDRDITTGPDGTVAVPDMTGEVGVDEACPGLTISQNPSAGTLVGVCDSPVAVTMVAIDTALLIDTCAVALTILDGTPPTAVLCGGQFVNSTLSVGIPVDDPVLTTNGRTVCASDNADACGGSLTIEVTEIDGDAVGSIPNDGSDPRWPDGHPTPIVPLGAHAVTFTITDASANAFVLPTTLVVLQAVPMGCWDLNQNGLSEVNEDRNGDGDYNALDCQGVSCWDLNGNLQCDGDEDINGDLVCDAKDCKGEKGDPGFSCWDLDMNHACDLASEDINADGVCDVKDCAGSPCWDLNSNLVCDLPAEDTDGDGICTMADCAGLACWDLNGNRLCDAATEDINGDTLCDAKDCAGAPCWDLDGNLTCDPASEDLNGDGACDVKDCAGLACWDLNGNGVGDPGEDVNGDGNYDTGDCQGVSCWDLNGNHIGELNEDRNGDGDYNALDCQGLPCWDLNENLTCDPATEDVNGDLACNALDCTGPQGPRGPTGAQGSAGTDGCSCWDLNCNFTGDIGEDKNADGNFDALDCQGEKGETGDTGPTGDTGREGPQGPPGETGETGATGQSVPFFGCGALSAIDLTAMMVGLISLCALGRRRYEP